MKPIIISGFPIPPSFNEQHAAVNGRLIKTAKARLFDIDVEFYKVKHRQHLHEIQTLLNPMMETHSLRVNFYFVIYKERLFTKTKKAESWAKQIDASNRLKSCQDALVKCLGIDDKLHFQNFVEKIACDHANQEQVIMTVELSKPRTLTELMVALSTGELEK